MARWLGLVSDIIKVTWLLIVAGALTSLAFLFGLVRFKVNLARQPQTKARRRVGQRAGAEAFLWWGQVAAILEILGAWYSIAHGFSLRWLGLGSGMAMFLHQ